MNNKTQFILDLETETNVNKGMYNLILSIRDVSLYTKGLKPSRQWKFNDVKKYFGVKGTAIQVLEQLKAIKETLK
jgi:hypothetical protein